MYLATWHWHIEISSKCTLRCPRCARQEVPDTLVNTELDLAFFQRNFTPEFVKNNVEKITFCGDDGDPIYAHDFIKVVEYLKEIKPSISIIIVTNGSYKTEGWWQDLSINLNENDQVHFSLDGWDQESNNKYRVNCNWDSIILGARTLISRSNCWTSWDAIGFKFNEDKIDFMRDKAKRLGFDQFQLTKSTKFGKIYSNYGDNDLLQPIDELISSSHRFERKITNLSGRERQEPWLETNIKLYDSIKQVGNIKPMCHIGNKGLYINSKGEFYPCCWVANRYGHNNKWADLGKKFDLKTVALSEIIYLPYWGGEFANDSFECDTKCAVERVNKNYATEW
jgi:MoaA/NifB/PqqE/SkfB family radical SAM enzyme